MTLLESVLEAAGVNTILIAGVGDQTLFATAHDARLFSYTTYVLEHASKGLDDDQKSTLTDAGAIFIQADGVPEALGKCKFRYFFPHHDFFFDFFLLLTHTKVL
jgi:nicotinamidase-related amidase